MIKTYLELCKVYTRLDQPKTAIDFFTKALEVYPNEIQYFCLVLLVSEVSSFDI